MKSKKNKLVIGFLGLSHLGLCYLVAAVSKNTKVIGIDKNKNIIENLRKNKILHVKENYLLENIVKYKKNILFSTDFKALIKCDIVFISQDVKTNNYGKSNFNILNSYISKAIKNMNINAELVLLSQVPPGFTRKIKWPKKQLFYNVETLVFGNAIFRAKFPERLIIGYDQKENINKTKIYKYLKSFKVPIISMSYESAEITKISINLILISNITVANEIGIICEKINASWNDVYQALILDKRIGKYAYIKNGLGLSGGNLERDLYNSIEICKKNSLKNDFFNSMLNSSKINKKWALNKFKFISKFLPKNSKIGILGLSYKENTNSTKNSPAITILKENKFKNIYCYDPLAELNMNNLSYKRENSFKKVIKNCDLLLIMTKWDEFKNINLKTLKLNMNKRFIIDPFGVLAHLSLNENGFDYFCKGSIKL